MTLSDAATAFPDPFEQSSPMKHHIGVLMQVLVLALLPVVVVWQLVFGIPLIVMPVCLLIGITLFTIGTRLRES